MVTKKRVGKAMMVCNGHISREGGTAEMFWSTAAPTANIS